MFLFSHFFYGIAIGEMTLVVGVNWNVQHLCGGGCCEVRGVYFFFERDLGGHTFSPTI